MSGSRIKSSICLCFGVVMFVSNCWAQEEKPYREPTGLNNWYVELGGSAGLYSLNFEQVLYRSTNIGWVGRIGASYSFAEGWFLNKVYLDNGAVIAPFTTSILLGNRDRKEKLEIGLGFNLINKRVGDREIIPTAVLGLRVIETNKVCFRILYTPFIRYRLYEHWFGVSIGRNFSIGKRR